MYVTIYRLTNHDRSMSSESKKTSVGALTCEDDVLMFDVATDQAKQVRSIDTIVYDVIITSSFF